MKLLEAYGLLLMVFVLVSAACVFLKNKSGFIAASMFGVCAAASLVSGLGLRVREIVEGPFAFLDIAMWSLCAAVFMALLYHNGTLSYLLAKITGKKRAPFFLHLLLMLFIAIPGMFTGTMTASLATTGLLAGTWMKKQEIETKLVVETVAMGALFGCLLPPLCIPSALTVLGRYNSFPPTYEGYFVPLLVLGVPALLVYSALSANRVFAGKEWAEEKAEGNAACLIPLAVVSVLVLCHNFLYAVLPFLGYPLIYTIGSVLAVFLKCKKYDVLDASLSGLGSIAPAVAMVFAFGAVIETLTMVGTNGTVLTHMQLLGINGIILGIACAFIFLVIGRLVGLGAVLVLAANCIYFLSEIMEFGAVAESVSSQLPTIQMPMLGLGVFIMVSVLLTKRNGLISNTCQILDEDESSTSAMIRTPAVLVSTLIILAVSLVYMITGPMAAILMI